jgi:hypothetical protein
VHSNRELFQRFVLADWEMIGVAAPVVGGGFQFEDPQAARFSSRFYRVGVGD